MGGLPGPPSRETGTEREEDLMLLKQSTLQCGAVNITPLFKAVK